MQSLNASTGITPPSLRAKAYSYLRFSTPEQRLGDSARRQIAGARAFAAEHNLDLDETFKDEGISAFKGKQRSDSAALGAFVRAVESGKVAAGSYLIVESLDRLSREEVLEALELFLSLTRKGIIIVALEEKQIYSRETLGDGPMLLMYSIISMSRAHQESALKSERVGKAWARKRELAETTKQAMTARCPAWIRLVGGPKTGHYELIEDRAAIVRSIFSDTIAGFGKRAIQARLNKEQTPTWGTGQKQSEFWHDSYVAKILENPATYGRFTPLGKMAGGSGEAASPIDDYFPAVISEDMFWHAQAVIKSRNFGKGKPGARRNLLSGLVRCSSCGRNMVLIDKRSSGSTLGLKCGRAHASAGCEHRTFYDYGAIETAAIWGLGKKRRQGLVDTSQDRWSQLSEALAAAVANRDAVQQGIDNLLDVVRQVGANGRIATHIAEQQAALEKAETEVRGREQALRLERPQDVQDAGESLERWYEMRQESRDDERTRASLQRKLKLLIDHIVVGDGKITVQNKDGSTSRTFISANTGTRLATGA